ncbi:hypothetical protein KR054_009915 [Drosophila jambulina]|nr:hypothetical protein KR054_009915 [Drosophila jambulina]
MFNFGTYFLWALAVFVLWRGSLADTGVADIETKAKLGSLVDQEARLRGQLEEVPSKMEGQLEEVNSKLEGQLQEVKAKLERVEAKLEGVETKLEGVESKLEGVEANLKGSLLAVQTSLESKLQAVLNQLQGASTTTEANVKIPSGFEKIGTRYFKIVNQKVKWITAERKCREMGGYLAAFRNEDEIKAITEKLQHNKDYWLALNDRDSEGHFVSVASNKPAKFFKWSEGQPNNYENNQNCVSLYNGKMWDDNCDNNYDFICQADNET